MELAAVAAINVLATGISMKLADAAAVRTYLPPGLVAPPLTALPADASNGKNKAAATAPMRENLRGRCNSALMRINRERALVRVVALRVSKRLGAQPFRTVLWA